LDFLVNLISFIVALGILVFVHEFGHFWVARKNGVKVLRFAVGFGKPIYSWHGKDGTEYVIGTIPLGGYVRMLDGRVDEVSEADSASSFDKKRVTQRIAIVFAGPLANFIFAIFALFVMYLVGVPAIKPIVGSTLQGSIAETGGLQQYDEIIQVADDKVADWEAANYAFLQHVGGERLSVKVQRAERTVDLQLNTAHWQINDGNLLLGLGITPFRPRPLLTLAHVVPNSPADSGGLVIGDELLMIDGERLTSWKQAADIFANSPDSNLTLTIRRSDEVLNLKVQPENRPDADGFSRGYLGVAPNVEKWPKGYVFNHQYGIFPALQKSMEKTWDLISLSFQMFGKLLTGKIGLDNLSGPISIAQGAGISAQSGFVYFISFLALISVNLGVVNLLPLPVLDGGHLMYFFIELIRGKPVSDRVQEIGFRIGAFALMMIMGIALMNDFGRL